MIFCHQCGNQANDTDTVCGVCGTSLQALDVSIDSEVSSATVAYEPPAASDRNTAAGEQPPSATQTSNEEKIDTNDIEEPSVPGGNGGETAHSGDTDREKRSGLKTLTEGTVLNNRYKILRKVGGGGMGAVYLAEDKNLADVKRAVKEMIQSSIDEDQQKKAIEDFRRESMILSTLDHPSIPTIYDYFFDEGEGRFYLVMKYISGGDLAGRLRAAPGGRIDERTVTEWAIQVADVLSYLHNLPDRIVYRDLKPSNLMLDGSTGRIMLIDFGIARSINQTERGVTAVGTMSRRHSNPRGSDGGDQCGDV